MTLDEPVQKMEPIQKKARLGGETDADLQQFLDATNEGYERVHLDFEEQFWGTKMALKEVGVAKQLKNCGT